MNTIIRHIEYLLSRTDCVIVPNFGAFLAHYQSAKIDAEGLVAYPPHRVFTFNSALKHNDGVLACSIARAQGISYDAALDLVYAGVQDIQQHLRKEGELVLGRIGQLIYEADTDSTQFFPATADMLTPFAACLPVVRKPEPKPVEEPVLLDSAPVIAPWQRIARLAASIALLIVIGFIASTPISVDDAAMASLYPELRQYTVDEILPAAPEKVGTVTMYTADKSVLSIDVDSTLREIEAKSHGFLIIVGSFANTDEANRFIALYPDEKLGIYEADGKCRVYVGDLYSDQYEAYRALQASKLAKKGAWVCKK